MDSETIIWIVIAVVVLAVLVGVAMMVSNRKKAEQAEENRRRAQEIRRDVGTGTAVRDADLEAREAKLEADRARLEAEQAQARAQEAEQSRDFEAARHEDALREADALDPDVDTRADDYQPTTPDPGAHRDPDTILDEGDRAATDHAAGTTEHAADRTTEHREGEVFDADEAARRRNAGESPHA